MQGKGVVGLLGMAGLVVVADNWVVAPILPAIAQDLGIDIARAGLLITAYMIPFGLCQLIFGPLADRYGKKRVITLAMIVFTLASGLCALGLGLTDLALYRALTGVFAASVIPISLAMIGDTFPLEQRQGAIGSFMGIVFLGQGLSMAIGGAIANFLSWRGVFAGYALLSVIPTLALIRSYGSLPSSRNQEARFLAPYRKLLTNQASRNTYLLIFLAGLIILGSFSYLGAYIAEIYHFNYLSIGLIMTSFGLATVVGGRLSGKLVEAMGPRRLLTFGFLLAAASELALGALGHWLVLLVAGISLMGFGFILAYSTLLTRATEFAREGRGSAMSLVAFSFMGGGGVGTALGGVLITHWGLSFIYYAYGIALLCTWLFSFVLIRDHDAAKDELVREMAE